MNNFRHPILVFYCLFKMLELVNVFGLRCKRFPVKLFISRVVEINNVENSCENKDLFHYTRGKMKTL